MDRYTSWCEDEMKCRMQIKKESCNENDKQNDNGKATTDRIGWQWQNFLKTVFSNAVFQLIMLSKRFYCYACIILLLQQNTGKKTPKIKQTKRKQQLTWADEIE